MGGQDGEGRKGRIEGGVGEERGKGRRMEIAFPLILA